MYKPVFGIHDVLRLDDPVEENPDPVVRHAKRLMNRAVWGSLDIDFESRRVTFNNIRGDHAMRFHGLVSDHRHGDPSSARWADQLDPPTADSGSRWITFNPSKVLAINWEPERLVYGNAMTRDRLSFAARVLMTYKKKPNITDWSPLEMADYLVVLEDLPGEADASLTDEASEPDESEPDLVSEDASGDEDAEDTGGGDDVAE